MGFSLLQVHDGQIFSNDIILVFIIEQFREAELSWR
jgi:hypothetical protein